MKFAINPANRLLQNQHRQLDLNQPRVMGVLNVTPDSFHDGGRFDTTDKAVTQALTLIEEGADWLDIGGESSGPGSREVAAEEEKRRVVEVIREVRRQRDIWISVDTYKATTALAALAAGADMINDVTALRGDAALLSVLKERDCPVILMYSKDSSARTTTEITDYDDVVRHLTQFFEARLEVLLSAEVARQNIMLDPGMGFFVSGKAEYSFEILARLEEMVAWGYPVLVGTSRKSFLAGVSPGGNLKTSERLIPSVVSSAYALIRGACAVRVHDVKEAVQMRDTLNCLGRARK